MGNGEMMSVRNLFVAALAMASAGLGAIVGAGEARAGAMQFTFEGAPNDANYRAIVSAVAVHFENADVVKSADCAYKDDLYRDAVYDQYRAANDLEADVSLLSATCDVEIGELCEIGFRGEGEVCHKGEAVLVFENVNFAEDGETANARAIIVFFGDEGRKGGRVVDIFKYDAKIRRRGQAWMADRHDFAGRAAL